jgi:hypothetical protein
MPVGTEPLFSSDWFRIPRACQYTQLPQSTLYEVIDDPENRIITFSLRLAKKQKRGIRYIWRPSLDAFLNRRAIADGVDPEVISEAPAKLPNEQSGSGRTPPPLLAGKGRK